jgi:EAL domain-containing protein (putative c-di-GMP-specific phosphodiesterase class I)
LEVEAKVDIFSDVKSWLRERCGGTLHQHRMKMESHLYRALKNDEYVLYFQPQVRVDDRRITGIEALIRWNSSKFGLVHPELFIPQAEKSDLIIKIGDWVIENSLKYMAAIHQNGDVLEIAINVAPLQLQASDFTEKLLKLIDFFKIPPEKIKLEITENTFMSVTEYMKRKMSALKDKGLKIVIDDFGTGYGSLVYLRDYPINEIKIKQRFLDDLEINRVDYIIVQHIIALGKALNVNVVAEGVEKTEQVEMLQSLGCHMMQGYYFSKPLCMADTTELLKQIRI